MRKKSWVLIFLFSSAVMIAMTGIVNYAVDPYSFTRHNLLNIPIKLVSDDRTEKVAVINQADAFDNILLGSSRVYIMNPLMVSRYIGGFTYNLGVGGAQPEDHLGLLLHLKKLGKFPRTIILGLDFYSFNEGLETNKYFLRNQDVNFIGNTKSSDDNVARFFSLDTLKASIQTLKVYFGIKKAKKHFDENGGSSDASLVFDYYPEEDDARDIYAIDKTRKASDFIHHPRYTKVSQRRLTYLKKIIEMSEVHETRLIIFITPLYGRLIEEILSDDVLSERLKVFKRELSKITSYYDFLTLNEITRSTNYFGDTSHMKTSTGNLVFARIFNDDSVDVPEGFGVFVKKDVVRP